MFYVARDKDGKIVSLSRKKTVDATESKTSLDSEIWEFLNNNDDEDSLRMSLDLSDLGLVRTIEDLIDLLIEKKIITFTELPVEAQKRIQERRRFRKKLSSSTVLVEEIL
ncbi:MAG TPA: hypothetical protein ENN79_11400 [Desulfobacteraceae bacterium]|jgi:hypothetical protein|nr:hypothetical protein [Desulfobacteraceae bacterium]